MMSHKMGLVFVFGLNVLFWSVPLKFDSFKVNVKIATPIKITKIERIKT